MPVGISETGIAPQIGGGMVTGRFMAGEDREVGEAEERKEVFRNTEQQTEFIEENSSGEGKCRTKKMIREEFAIIF